VSLACVDIRWYYCVRDRIPVAAATLKCSAVAVTKYPHTIAMAFALTTLQIGETTTL
jgi:hypothetical protein